jgi:hypothetical protein
MRVSGSQLRHHQNAAFTDGERPSAGWSGKRERRRLSYITSPACSGRASFFPSSFAEHTRLSLSLPNYRHFTIMTPGHSSSQYLRSRLLIWNIDTFHYYLTSKFPLSRCLPCCPIPQDTPTLHDAYGRPPALSKLKLGRNEVCVILHG